MARALIIGGGAIGRGFMPWLLDNFELDILDSSESLTKGISAQGGFHSFMSDGEQLHKKWVQLRRIAVNFEELDTTDYAIAFISVGPRNVMRLPAGIEKLNCPIFSWYFCFIQSTVIRTPSILKTVSCIFSVLKSQVKR